MRRLRSRVKMKPFSCSGSSTQASARGHARSPTEISLRTKRFRQNNLTRTLGKPPPQSSPRRRRFLKISCGFLILSCSKVLLCGYEKKSPTKKVAKMCKGLAVGNVSVETQNFVNACSASSNSPPLNPYENVMSV